MGCIAYDAEVYVLVGIGVDEAVEDLKLGIGRSVWVRLPQSWARFTLPSATVAKRQGVTNCAQAQAQVLI